MAPNRQTYFNWRRGNVLKTFGFATLLISVTLTGQGALEIITVKPPSVGPAHSHLPPKNSGSTSPPSTPWGPLYFVSLEEKAQIAFLIHLDLFIA